ncbi:MAG: formate dehydrogenase accessory sulfurtransferase FdhD [Nocardioidaceae bacterium]
MSGEGRPGTTVRRRVVEVSGGTGRRLSDSVITEEPMEIRLGWPGHPAQRVAVVMRTPGADFELATGFLLSEGVMALRHTPKTVAYCLDRALSLSQHYNVVTVTLDEAPLRVPAHRSTDVSSACGVCGVDSLADVFTAEHEPLQVTCTVASDVLTGLPETLRDQQRLFGLTGSIHAAGVFDTEGRLVVAREDIGRHNAVDKVLGARQLGVTTYDQAAVLCVSGRIGFDIVTKAVAGQLGTVIAVGGPSSLAVELADRAGITLCGFARGERFVIYTHPARIHGV